MIAYEANVLRVTMIALAAERHAEIVHAKDVAHAIAPALGFAQVVALGLVVARRSRRHASAEAGTR